MNTNISFSELGLVSAFSSSKMAEIKQSIPQFRGYSVYSSRFGQCKVSTGVEVFKEFSNMFEPSPELITIMNEIKKKTFDLDLVHSLGSKQIVRDDVFLEIRFDQLNYETIRELKSSDLISRKYTDPNNYSIRIVLARLNEIKSLQSRRN